MIHPFISVMYDLGIACKVGTAIISVIKGRRQNRTSSFDGSVAPATFLDTVCVSKKIHQENGRSVFGRLSCLWKDEKARRLEVHVSRGYQSVSHRYALKINHTNILCAPMMRTLGG